MANIGCLPVYVIKLGAAADNVVGLVQDQPGHGKHEYGRGRQRQTGLFMVCYFCLVCLMGGLTTAYLMRVGVRA